MVFGIPVVMAVKRKLSRRIKRFGAWLKQVILLGRIDWRKASDDANPPRLTPAQREEMRPQFDVNAIRPRTIALERAHEARMPERTPTSAEADAAKSKQPKSRQFRRQHHDRSRRTAVNPLAAFAPEKQPASGFQRLVAKLFGRRE